MLFICIKKDYTLEINSQICWQEVLLPVLSKLCPQNLKISLNSLSLLVRLKCILNEILFLFGNNFFAQYIVEL